MIRNGGRRRECGWGLRGDGVYGWTEGRGHSNFPLARLNVRSFILFLVTNVIVLPQSKCLLPAGTEKLVVSKYYPSIGYQNRSVVLSKGEIYYRPLINSWPTKGESQCSIHLDDEVT